MSDETLRPSLTRLSPEQQAADEAAELRAALTVVAGMYELGPEATWVDLVRVKSAIAEEGRLREEAPRLGLEVDASIEDLRTASHEASEAFYAKFRARRPESERDEPPTLTAEQEARQEQDRQEIIERLNLPSDTPIQDAREASVLAYHEVARQQKARSLGLPPAASSEEINAAEQAAIEVLIAKRAEHGGTRTPHPEEYKPKIGAVAVGGHEFPLRSN